MATLSATVAALNASFTTQLNSLAAQVRTQCIGHAVTVVSNDARVAGGWAGHCRVGDHQCRHSSFGSVAGVVVNTGFSGGHCSRGHLSAGGDTHAAVIRAGHSRIHHGQRRLGCVISSAVVVVSTHSLDFSTARQHDGADRLVGCSSMLHALFYWNVGLLRVPVLMPGAAVVRPCRGCVGHDHRLQSGQHDLDSVSSRASARTGWASVVLQRVRLWTGVPGGQGREEEAWWVRLVG